MGVTRGLSYFIATGVLLVIAGCGSNLPLEAPSPTTSSLPAVGPVPACGALLPLDVPHLTSADAKTAVGTSVPTCELVDTGAGQITYRPSSLSSAQTLAAQWMNWLPFDGGTLPPGCVRSLQKRLFVQINRTWYEARNVGCGTDLPATRP